MTQFVVIVKIILTVLETPHIAVGAAIGVAVANPILAIPLAFASHFILEKVPHWNPHLNTETQKYGKPTKQSTYIVIVDISVALVIGSYIAYQALPDTSRVLTILACCLAASLPDIVEGPYFFLRQRSEKIKRWIAFQKSIQSDTSLVPGLITQAITVGLALFWALT